MKKTVVLWPAATIILLTYSPSVAFNESTGRSALKPLDDSHCLLMDKVLQNIIHSTDVCIFMVLEHIDCPLHVVGPTMVTASLEKLFSGFVFDTQNIFLCDKTFTMFTDWKMFRYFMAGRDLTKKFQPFTRLGFFARFDTGHANIFDKATQVRQIYLGALHVYYGKIVNGDFFQLEELITDEVIAFSNISYLERVVKRGRDLLMHPLFDPKVQKNEVNVSLFHCDPHVIKLDNKGTLQSYDGAEYRFLLESTKDWELKIFDHSNMLLTGDPWSQSTEDVADGISNFALCSNWLTDHLVERFDVSGCFSHQCGTFLVPRPAPIAHASYIYYPLEDEVWILIFAFLFITAALYYFFSRIIRGGWWTSFNVEEVREGNPPSISRSFVDIINIATGHGLPRMANRSPIQILLISWILLSLLLGTVYNTKLMSVLARPLFSKAVDTVHDFVEADLFWGEIGERPMMKQDFIDSGNPDYKELANRMRNERDLAERFRNIESGKYARFVKFLSNNYVMDTETIANYSSYYRLMKTCVSEYFTVFPFDKKSPYVRYFNMKLGRFAQAGIINYWIGKMSTKYGQTYMRSFVEKGREPQTSDPTPLKIENFIGAFFVLGIGLGLASVVFLIENVCHRKVGNQLNVGG